MRLLVGAQHHPGGRRPSGHHVQRTRAGRAGHPAAARVQPTRTAGLPGWTLGQGVDAHQEIWVKITMTNLLQNNVQSKTLKMGDFYNFGNKREFFIKY